MKLLFDNCTSPALAYALDGFIQHEDHRAFHIKDMPGLPKGRHSADLDWIALLKALPEVWAFVSGDQRLTKNPAERAALRSAGLYGFLLAPVHQSTPLNQVAASLLWQWPNMVQTTRVTDPPAMYEVPIGRMKRLKPVPL